jgi:hypothetical protein
MERRRVGVREFAFVNRRVVIAAVVAMLAAAMLGVQSASVSREGGPAPTMSPSGACALTVTSVAYARNGTPMLPGDVILLDRMTPAQRVLATHDSSAVGEVESMVVQRDGRTIRLAATVASPEPASYWAPSFAVKIVMLLAGVFLLWRGRDAASLHYGIASSFFAVAILPLSDAILSPAARNIDEALAQVFAGISAFALYLTFEDLARGAIREKVLTACRIVVAACSLLFIANAVEFSFARSGSGCFVPALFVLRYPALMVALAVMLGVLGTTFIRATGLQRQRVRWVFWSTIVGFSGVVLWLIDPALRAAVLTSVVITIGYAYAILRHRVIDVGFVINRAIVFTTVTGVVFAVFALVSTLVEKLTLPSGESIVVQSAVALALAFSFDFGYKRVERLIDQVFFRDRHNAEVAVRRFTDEARFAANAAGLLGRALSVVCTSLRATAACVYEEHSGSFRLAAASGRESFPQVITADDAAIACLRADMQDVDLADIQSALTGEGYGFALAVQGRLIGVLVVRGRDDAEAFDPEERSLVRALAREVAHALQAIAAADNIAFIAALAAGDVDQKEARERAQTLIAREPYENT